MTSLEPHGQNGGAGLVAVSLVRNLSALARELDFTLLTDAASHAELQPLDAPNVRRHCVVARPRSRSGVRALAARVVPAQARVRLQSALWSLQTKTSRKRAPTNAGERPDLLFCPFSVPYFWQAGVPCVCIVYDLQYVSYPTFFTAEQRLNRERQLVDACRKSERVVCISDYVRSTVLANVDVPAERVQTIPLGLLHEPVEPDEAVVDRLGLDRGEFLLYPANFWPHKNHRVLFEALRLFRATHPDSPLKLVCTGAPNALMGALEVAAKSALPEGTVVFAGYLAERELTALLDASAALVFPSLYEGFGMPVLEGMAAGKPVLCSNVTSLPEVASDAATYFDPTKPQQIASAIAALNGEPSAIASRVACGRQRAASFGNARDMAVPYLALFRHILSASPA
jgi:glycosyltransferase involved in cell wall biosynthesis